ncbi:MAG: hypothetical protein FJY67_04455 [Calditrichaeota bacterium]|nr:hypothetical protein [Calditrichota bacterium]
MSPRTNLSLAALVLLAALTLFAAPSEAWAVVNYTVHIEPDGGDNPAVGTLVWFQFGDEDPISAEVDQFGDATIERPDWFGGNWSALIDARLTPLNPASYSQQQGGSNNTMNWVVEGQ